MNQTITTIEKNSIDEIRVGLSDFKGHDLIGVRVFAETDKGEKVPTKKGLTCNVRLIADLIKALQEAEKEVQAEGLLEWLK